VKTLVVYDSAYGNTERIARACADALAPDSKLVTAAEAGGGGLRDVDLLVVGSPTQGGRPTAAVQAFLKTLPSGDLAAKAVAAFDTRLLLRDQVFPLRLLMRLIGYAAARIAASLQAKGGQLVLQPEGFIVEGKEGPLRDGELERAAAWARKLAESALSPGNTR
jgi:flavodoxin